jgi:hypothetical protein
MFSAQFTPIPVNVGFLKRTAKPLYVGSIPTRASIIFQFCFQSSTSVVPSNFCVTFAYDLVKRNIFATGVKQQMMFYIDIMHHVVYTCALDCYWQSWRRRT